MQKGDPKPESDTEHRLNRVLCFETQKGWAKCVLTMPEGKLEAPEAKFPAKPEEPGFTHPLGEGNDKLIITIYDATSGNKIAWTRKFTGIELADGGSPFCEGYKTCRSPPSCMSCKEFSDTFIKETFDEENMTDEDKALLSASQMGAQLFGFLVWTDPSTIKVDDLSISEVLVPTNDGGSVSLIIIKANPTKIMFKTSTAVGVATGDVYQF
ncbi:unnamed protein product [Vitrella brassicaformis CCMP3155]|uniref:Uncharacterized protein n=1 Tax=Vitrella brassicaformis (strain CCMP3155) TaxID=1169540 RepID=A0A0G4F393_VITBC|nr:unnamed protein product [Vitrella brassicaformis CCMP3155]|eukprot:CEM06207.1 unnamed protein product [Vitrella brassicaformis CCMP3155]